MRKIRCRNCGGLIDVPDYHNPKHIVCPHCDWQEVIPARHKLPKKLAHQAGHAFEAHQEEHGRVHQLTDHLEELSPTDFEGLCADLFDDVGYIVSIADPSVQDIYALELRQGDELTLAACDKSPPSHRVDRMPLENLAGAMRARGVEKGVFITTGVFADECIEFAENAGITLIDGEALHEKLDDLPAEVIRKWFE